MEPESIYELFVQAARDRLAELTDLGRDYNQIIIDKYKELTKHGNS